LTLQPEDVDGILSGKLALNYIGRDIDAMKQVANAHKNRSLLDFEQAKATYTQELTLDPIIHSHLSELYSTLLEQNLIRIIEPFSVVEISHIAKLIKLPLEQVERKLSQMILDDQLYGVLDQGAGHLIVYDDPPEDKTYKASLGTIDNMSIVVDALYDRANKIQS
jgi:26S proteasome regulatory subunit N6